MKIGVISDIHGNIEALNKVLEEFEKQKVQKIICCGDIIGIGPEPEQCVQKLMEYRKMLIAVRGNHEQYFFKGIPEEIHDDKRRLGTEEKKHHKWTQKRLSEESIKFLEQFPLHNIIEIEGKKIYITHYPSDKNEKYKEHIKKPNNVQIEKLFDDVQADIYLYGHTHVANFNKINQKIYINPGSLGCPENSNIANAGMITINENKAHYNRLKIEYDVKKTICEIKKTRYPLYKKILFLFFGSNKELVYAINEKVKVKEIKKIKKDFYKGEVRFNGEIIETFVIGQSHTDYYNGNVVGIIKNNEKEYLIVSNDDMMEYAKMKGYFKDIEEFKNATFRCKNEKSAGAILYKKFKDKIMYLIIYSKKGIAGFPKGHVEYGESDKQAAIREIKEEIDLDIQITKDFEDTFDYYVDDTVIYKKVVFYLAELPKSGSISIEEKEINSFGYYTIEEAEKILNKSLFKTLKKADRYIQK